MTDDPDELKYEHAIRQRDPVTSLAGIEEIEVHLRYGIAGLKFLGWLIVVLLALILWRVW